MIRLQGFTPKDRQKILEAYEHTQNVLSIMLEWEDATGTKATGAEYEGYYEMRIKELEQCRKKA